MELTVMFIIEREGATERQRSQFPYDEQCKKGVTSACLGLMVQDRRIRKKKLGYF